MDSGIVDPTRQRSGGIGARKLIVSGRTIRRSARSSSSFPLVARRTFASRHQLAPESPRLRPVQRI